MQCTFKIWQKNAKFIQKLCSFRIFNSKMQSFKGVEAVSLSKNGSLRSYSVLEAIAALEYASASLKTVRSLLARERICGTHLIRWISASESWISYVWKSGAIVTLP